MKVATLLATSAGFWPVEGGKEGDGSSLGNRTLQLHRASNGCWCSAYLVCMLECALDVQGGSSARLGGLQTGEKLAV